MSIYRPPNRDYEYLESLCLLIHDVVSKNPKSAIWIGGDLNLPNIDWATNSVLSHDYPLPFCNLVIDTFNSLGFVQLVTFPTRKNNTLDIFATNRPSLVENCFPIPGIGDHEAVLI